MKTLLSHWRATKTGKNRIQITIISVSIKNEKQSGTTQLSKYVVYRQDVQKAWTNVDVTKTKYRKL